MKDVKVMIRLKRVKIRNFMGIRGDVELELSPTLTVIYGPNWTGKTSILNAIQWCLCCNSGTDWRTIMRIFDENKIVNERANRAFVTIEYEANGEKYFMWARTKRGTEWAFEKEDNGPFKNIPIGRVEFSDFIIGITHSQIERFLSEEELKGCLDLVFGVKSLKEIIERIRELNSNALDVEEHIVREIFKVKERLEKLYFEALEEYEERRNNIKNIDLEHLIRELSDILDKPIDELPQESNKLLLYLKEICTSIDDELKKIRDRKERAEKELREIISTYEERKRELEEIEKFLEEAESKLKNIEELQKFENTREKLENRIKRLQTILAELDEKKFKLSLELDESRRKRSSKEIILRRLKDFRENIISINKKLLELNERQRSQRLSEVLKRLEEYNESKKKLGEKSENLSEELDLLQKAISYMKRRNLRECVICGNREGRIRAEQRKKELEMTHKEVIEELNKLELEIEKLNEERKELEDKVKEIKELRNRLEELGNMLNNFLREKNLPIDLEQAINSLAFELDQMRKNEESMKEELQSIEAEIKHKNEELSKILNNLREVNEKINSLRQEENYIRRKLAELGYSNAWSISLNDIENKIIPEIEKRREELDRTLSKLSEETKSKEKEINELMKRYNDLSRKLDVLRKKKRTLENNIRELQEFRNWQEFIEKELENVFVGAIEDILEKIEDKLSHIEKYRAFLNRVHEYLCEFAEEYVRENIEEFNSMLKEVCSTLYDHPEFREVYIKPKEGRYKICVKDSLGNELDERVLSTSCRDIVRLAIAATSSIIGLRGEEEFSILLIDEPQSHLDSTHKEKFVTDFLPKVCRECQIIIATMDDELWKLIQEHTPNNAILYKIEEWSIDEGPKIKRVKP